MFLNNINITNFRNLIDTQLKFHRKVNCIYGDNAQGKTNLFESMFFLLRTKSFREEAEENLISESKDYLRVGGSLISGEESKEEKTILQIFFSSKLGQNKKALFFNNKQVSNKNYLQNAKCLLFCWEDIYLIEGTPKIRRNFLDSEISALDYNYRKSLQKYKNALENRNKLLKLKSNDINLYKTYEEILSQAAEFIISSRNNFLQELRIICCKYFNNFLEKEIQFQYINSCNALNYNEYLTVFNNFRMQEQQAGFTLNGVHRDDFKFITQHKNFKEFSSLGEKKLLVLIIKIALAEYVKKKTSKMPVILLDDIITDFDENKETIVLNNILNKEYQCFLTFIKNVEFPFSHKSFKIINGELTEIS